ncbi:MAG: FecR domain-containing protein [Rickettsiales bacterium]|nr:FecR domain-containing protein [Rickettsiales bacterium]
MKPTSQLLFGMVITTLLTSPAWAAQKVGVVGAQGAMLSIVGADKATRIAKTGDEVFLGDTLTTDATGKAQVVFLDRSSITLKPNSNLTVDRFVYDPSTAQGDLALKSAKGAFRFIGGALSKKKPVTLTTPVGTIGIRGGIADATIEANGETDAFFLYGEEMSFANKNGDQGATTVYGTGLSLTTPDAQPQPTPTVEVAAHFDGFRTAPTDAPLPGAPDADSINNGLNLGTESQTPLAQNSDTANVSSDGTVVAANNGDGNGGGDNSGGDNGGGDNSGGTPNNGDAANNEPNGGDNQNQSASETQSANNGPANSRTDAANPSNASGFGPNGGVGNGNNAGAGSGLNGAGANFANSPLALTNVTGTAAQNQTDGAISREAGNGPVTAGGSLSVTNNGTTLPRPLPASLPPVNGGNNTPLPPTGGNLFPENPVLPPLATNNTPAPAPAPGPAPVNNAPVFSAAIPNVIALDSTAFSFQIPATAFTDPESDPLTYSVTGLPAGWTYNSATGTISFTPNFADVEAGTPRTLTVTASDGTNISAATTFDVQVNKQAFTQKGQYFAKELDGGRTKRLDSGVAQAYTTSSGDVRIQRSGSTIATNDTFLSFNDNISGAGNVMPGNTTYEGTDAFNSGSALKYVTYRSLGGSLNYYNFEVTGGANQFNQITYVFGTDYESLGTPARAAMIAATTATSRAADYGNSYNVGFYNFLPGLNQNISQLNEDSLGLFSYNILQPASTLSNFGSTYVSSDVAQNPTGLAVNWENKTFLTSHIQWEQRASAHSGMSENSQLVAAFGQVTPGGANFFNGAGYSYEGVNNTTSLNSVGFDDLARGDIGSISNGKSDVYGNAALGVEGFVLNGNVNNRRSINLTNLSTTNASQTVTINAPNHGLTTGNNVTLSGLAALGGFTALQLTDTFNVTVTGPNSFTITMPVAASGTGSLALSGTGYVPTQQQESQLAVNQALGTGPANDALRADLGRFTTLPSSRTLNGFAGGLGIYDHKVFGTHQVGVYQSDNVNDVFVMQNKDAGSVSASLNLSKVNTPDPDDGISATFNGSSAFVGHRLWGVNQTDTGFRNDLSVTTNGTNTQGALVAATHTTDAATAKCLQCHFVEWGVWAGDSKTPDNKNYVVNMIPVVVGEVTDHTALPNISNATYNGPAYGSFVDTTNNKISNNVGTMMATVDLTAQTIDTFDLNFSNVHGNNISLSTAGTSIDNVGGKALFTSVGSSTLGGSANVKGAFFGPSGQNIGGNFSIDSSTIDGAGVFLGARP